MSIRVMTAVWDHAAVEGGTLLVLLAMADWANDDGTGVYPTQSTLAKKARLQDRQVRNCLTELEDLGYIERDGKRGTVINWRVDPDPANIAGRQPAAGSSGNGVPTEPSTNHQEGKADAFPSKKDVEDLGEAKPSRYLEPETPGSAAAPWLVIELARLMRANDEKCKLPVGLRELMAPEYLVAYPDGFKSLEKRRELIAPVLDKPALLKWLDAARLLIDSDERPGREVVEVLRWTQQDNFEKTNVLSFPKLRQRYDQLRGKALQDRGRAGSAAAAPVNASSQMSALAKRAAEQRAQVEGEGG